MGFIKSTSFFSCAHNDNTFDFLTNLRADSCAEYRLVPGDKLELDTPRDEGWGLGGVLENA